MKITDNKWWPSSRSLLMIVIILSVLTLIVVLMFWRQWFYHIAIVEIVVFIVYFTIRKKPHETILGFWKSSIIEPVRRNEMNVQEEKSLVPDEEVARKPGKLEAETHPVLFYTINFLCFAVIVAAYFLATPELEGKPGTGMFGTDFSARSTVVLLVNVWLLASVRWVRFNQLGAILCWGIPMIQVGSGPKLILVGVFQSHVFNRSVTQDEFPEIPELIQKTKDDVALEWVDVIVDGKKQKRQKVRPIRVMTGPKIATSKSILNAQMVLELTFWIRWRIFDPFAVVLHADGDVGKILKQMRDTAESALIRDVTQLTPEAIVNTFGKVTDDLHDHVQKTLRVWGVEVEEIGLNSPDVGYTLSKAMKEIANATADAEKAEKVAEKVVTEAGAEKKRLTLTGEGNAAARKAMLTAEGEGYMEASAAMGDDTTPAELLAAHVITESVGKGDLVVGLGDLSKIVALGKTAFKQANSINQVDPGGES